MPWLAAANVETGQRALAGGSDAIPEALDVMITDPEGTRSYPIVTYTWLLLPRQYEDPAKTTAVKDLAGWMLTQGQSHAEPLPENIAQAAQGQLAKLGDQRAETRV
jgi:ABC-type phosphate transport system substrate-binding protein